ncbi:Fatty acid hydroxylase superfamily protein [Chitinophaga terrae (ex Kim and Jung 2007)]|uniref:Fatty acid hydroxylase superfamily protein n=2 Tax=Chitinophaga terrae (ex Kim and Jung 2007) TaxID=408074 RepID=A0A1H4CIZ4_9BACT|nr:Fatty acid hydroxylase superfamily protein [Chitinophaga terrae (ex Kim and Jung 2007)]
MFAGKMEDLFQSLVALPFPLLFLVIIAENLVVFLIPVALGYRIRRAYGMEPHRVSRQEWQLALLTVLINSLITYAGAWAWKHQLIHITFGWSWRSFADVLILLLAMDLLMYIFHYAIHHTVLYRYIHGMHHEAVDPTPIDLFILHPIETIGFGMLWLVLLVAGDFNIWGIIVYLALNIVSGIVGHLGFEPLRVDTSTGRIAAKWLGTSAFHHRHHQDITANFGFYTSIWDRVFGTYKEGL